MTNPNQLETIVEQIGEAVIATTDTVEKLAERVDSLAVQVQQQGYQIFALTETMQAFLDSQSDSKKQLSQLTEALQTLIIVIKNKPLN